VFVTVGVGGVCLYNVKNNDPEVGYFSAWSGQNRNPALGTRDVLASAKELAARFVPAEGYSFTDSFTLQRNSPPGPAGGYSCRWSGAPLLLGRAEGRDHLPDVVILGRRRVGIRGFLDGRFLG
jgi:hypothetical protein